MKIKEVAIITGITVRTLQYYDEIGLLKPSNVTESKYRIYNKKDLELLQQILFFRELDFSLNSIKEIINNPSFNINEALTKQKQLLLKKRDRLNDLIELIDKSIKGDNTMSFKEFDNSEIEKYKNEYEEEVKSRWGKTNEYAESKRKISNYDKEKWNEINKESEEIFKQFADKVNTPASSEEVQSLVEKWQNHISKYYYNCTNEILASLGSMYVYDERFKNNIDKYRKGTAEFISKAIEIYCQ